MNLTTGPLAIDTWDAFAELGERHNGVWGGCWCLWFHTRTPEMGQSPERNQEVKKQMVADDLTHASLVFDGDAAVGWCQYGTPEELPRIYHRKQYEKELHQPADYRITCFFVGRGYRRQGVSAVALQGALDLIAQAGGGLVEAFPQDTKGEKVSSSFLYNGTRNLFERAGFEYQGAKGKNHCVMTKRVDPAATGVS
ncbi:MAG: GNAT family N-acetyltransferase [Acidimicrobiia bacterium]|nr:GNAT family N-acetyltransferase [Acidimicrobiia bacterium]